MIAGSNASGPLERPALSSETALVTGGTGFVGRGLVKLLVSLGQRVVVLDNLSLYAGGEAPAPAEGAELVAGDIRDGDLVKFLLDRERPRSLYHLAAIHYIPACDRDPAGCVSVNTAGTASVLEACSHAAEAPVCVLASTAAVYAPANAPHAETDPLGPVDIYGLSKLWLEQLADLYVRRNRLRVVVARIFNVYGPGETNPHLIPSLIDQALAGGVIRVGDLTTRRDYVHVDDVSRALVAMARMATIDGLDCINIGTGRAVSGREVVDTMALCLDRMLEVEVDPSRLRSVDRPVLLADTRRAAGRLGWQARVSFRDGMRELLNASLASGARV